MFFYNDQMESCETEEKGFFSCWRHSQVHSSFSAWYIQTACSDYMRNYRRRKLCYPHTKMAAHSSGHVTAKSDCKNKRPNINYSSRRRSFSYTPVTIPFTSVVGSESSSKSRDFIHTFFVYIALLNDRRGK